MTSSPGHRLSHASRLVGLAVLVAGCSLAKLWTPPSDPVAASGVRVGIEDRDGVNALVIRLRRPDGEAVAVAGGVRLVLGDGEIRELPFTSHVIAGDRLEARCGKVTDHDVRVTVMAHEHGAHIAIDDSIELPTRIAELSIEFRLVGEPEGSPATDRETFAPVRHTEPGTVAGDATWRTPVAFLRSGPRALALLPDVGGGLARTLPGALEISTTPQLSIRHGMVAQRTRTDGDLLLCERAPELSTPVVGQTLSVRHELRLWVDAQPRHTLRDVLSSLWDRGLAASSASRLTPIASQAEPILARRPALPAGDQPLELPFSARENANLLAAALAVSRDQDVRATSRILLALTNTAPQRSGLSPAKLSLRSRTDRHWTHTNEVEPFYDATAVSWTRVCGLWAARHLANDDPVRLAVERSAAALATFLLDNQQPSGAIPARYDTIYLAPVRDHLYDPAPESGAAALLLAEVGSAVAESNSDLAARARAGAIAALGYLQREVLPESAWFDSETGGATATYRARGTLALTFATLASLRVLESGEHADTRATAQDLLDELTRQQQTWTPAWLAADPALPSLFGGFGRHDADPTWSDPRQALAALALLHGFEQFGRRELLQRGVRALQAALARVDPANGDHTALSRFGVAAAIGALVEARCGHAIVDLQHGFVESIDGAVVTASEPVAGEIRLAVRSPYPAPEQLRVSFRNLPPAVSQMSILCNGRNVGWMSAAALREGITLTPIRVPLGYLAPPTSIQIDQTFSPRVVFAYPPPPAWRGNIEFSSVNANGRATNWTSRLRPAADPLVWITEEPLLPNTLTVAGGTMRARALLLDNQGESVTIAAATPITVGRETIWPIAGLDDVDCASRTSSPRTLFVDGAHLARLSGPAPSPLRWNLAVDPGTPTLDVELLLAGRLTLLAGESIIHEDSPEVGTVARTLRLTIADRRLWESGVLPLAFVDGGQPGAPRLQVAELRVRAAASSTKVDPALGQRTRSRPPDPRLEVLVVPIALADQPLRLSRDQLATILFGEVYVSTPDPNPHVTAGSVRHVIAAASGGRTQLFGEIAEPVASDLLGVDLRSGNANLAQLIALAEPAVARAATKPDVLLLIHGGTDLGTRIAQAGPVRVADAIPVAVVAEQATDGSALPVGDSVAALLSARYGLERVDTAETGNFGALALAGSRDQHLAPSPLGLDLAQLGWADLIDIAGAALRDLTAGPLPTDRRVFRLTTDVVGRGELYLEARGGVPGDAGLPEPGLLAYWRLSTPPLICSADGSQTYPRRLRLARTLGVAVAPFQPGSGDDLLKRASVIDDRAVPSLATPEGELFFRLRDLAATPAKDDRPTPQVGMVVESLARDLCAEPPSAAVEFDSGRVPIASDGVDVGFGSVHSRDRALRLHAGTKPLQLTWPGRTVDGRANRLFGRGRITGGPVRLRIGQGDTVAMDTIVEDTTRDLLFTVDLFAPRDPDSQLWMEFAATTPTPASLAFSQLLTVPRARPDHTPLRFERLHSARLSDGKLHAPLAMITTGSNGRERLVEPTLLPARRVILRLRCGLGFDAPEHTSVKLNVVLQSLDGRTFRHPLLEDFEVHRGTGIQPILTALLHVPPAAEARTAMLSIEVSGAPGTTLWIAAAEVTRP